MNRAHDLLEASVNLLARPGEPHAVLRHLKSGDGDASRVGGLAGAVQDFRVQQVINRLGGRGHVRALADNRHAVHHEVLRILRVQLVLSRAWERAIRCDRPQRVALKRRISPRKVCGWKGLDILFDPAASLVLQAHHPLQLLRGNAVRIVDEAAGIRECHHLPAKLGDLLYRVLGNVARTGDKARLALQ